jgi:hypothetical protein
VLLLVFGLGCCQLSIYDLQLLAFEEQYIDAELEITKYHLIAEEGKSVARRPHGRRRNNASSRRNPIDGIIHPGGIPVHTNDRDISLSVLDESDSVVVDRPLREEVEGQRIPVLYWTGDPAVRQWYHPPIVTNTPRPSPVRTGIMAVLCGGFLFGSVACFRYGYNRRRAAIHQKAERVPRKWPAWTFLCLTGCAFTWPFLWLIVLVFTKGYKVNRTGTERIPWTTYEWTMGGVAIGLASIIPLVCAVGMIVAIRKRLAYQRKPEQS